VVARALRSSPDWIIAVNPTRGLDIGATQFVWEQLRAARAYGAAIVLISTDLDELAALADRAAIFSSGSLAETRLDRARLTEIGLLLGGVVPEFWRDRGRRRWPVLRQFADSGRTRIGLADSGLIWPYRRWCATSGCNSARPRRRNGAPPDLPADRWGHS